MPGFEEDRDYFNQDGSVKAKKLKPVKDVTSSGALSFAKVFLYMFIYLAITAAVAFGVGYIISTSYANAVAAGGTGDEVLAPYLGILIGSAIALLVMTLIINFIVIRGKHNVLVPSILYSIIVGLLFSALTIFVDWKIMGMSFGITAGIFAIMALIAMFTKGNMAPLGMMGIGLFIGAGILVLVNLIMRSTTIYWIVSFVIFAAIMFITMFDIWNIKKITEQGSMDRNISYYCAFVMYVDFINIFLRILYFLLIIFGNKK